MQIMNTMPDLSGFTGSETFFRHGLNRSVTYTEGVQHLAESVGAYWLLDIIATRQLEPPVKDEEFQVWKLQVFDNNKADLTCEDGNDRVVHTQTIEFTDFPKEGITLWFTGNAILLPSEY